MQWPIATKGDNYRHIMYCVSVTRLAVNIYAIQENSGVLSW